MKIHLAYISNSSSSSFVLCGYKTTDPAVQNMLSDVDSIGEWAEEHDLDYECDNNLIGKNILYCYEGDEESVTLADLNDVVADVRKQLAELGITVEPKIYVGISYS